MYKKIRFNVSLIADSLKIDAQGIDNSLPKQIVSTGLFTLPICVRSLDVLRNIRPDLTKVRDICNRIGVDSFHVFTFETIEPDSVYHARNFAPVCGVNEDPVTGTANGAVSSYLVKHKIIEEHSFICEQGDIIGRPGRVFVEICNDAIKVGDKARIAQEREIEV